MEYRIAVDIGGTCTDTTVMDDTGRVFIGKSLSTYPDFSEGIFNSIADATDEMSVGPEELIRNTSLFFHATTVGENAIFERDGADTGLLTTAGFEETLHAARGGYGRWSGLPYQQVIHPVKTDKPAPLVPLERIRGISERASREGVIQGVDEDEVTRAVEELVEAGAESIACCFLWSFAYPENEERVREILADRYPDMFISISSQVAPIEGEYERTSTAVLNSYLGPTTSRYLDSLADRMGELGFAGTILLMFSHGGLVSRSAAVEKPVGLIESGPVSGLIGSKYISNVAADVRNIISTDMGGTTFKVGVIQEDVIDYAGDALVDRYHYRFPKRDVHSIAVAGGSVVSLEDGIPRVGPESAGSDPGPVCYDLGGEEPTVTDVDLIQGYFSPEYFLGGDTEINVGKAHDVFEDEIARPLGKGKFEAAADIYKLCNSMIADLLREVTIEKGIDPRKFTLSSIGGAAGMHASAYARELDIPQVIVPYSASVHSAFGLLSTDVTHEDTQARYMDPPFDLAAMRTIFDDLEADTVAKLDAEGFDSSDVRVERFVSMRYAGQVHEIVTPVRSESELRADGFESVRDRFETMYENRYGAGSTVSDGTIEITEFRVRGSGVLDKPGLRERELGDADPSDARIGRKEIYFSGAQRQLTSDLYEFDDLRPGNEIEGPSVIVTPVTSVVIHPSDEAWIDPYRNVRIAVGGGES